MATLVVFRRALPSGHPRSISIARRCLSSPSGSPGKKKHYDVLIAGGGAVGLTFARLLRDRVPGGLSSLRLGIVEGRVPPPLSAFGPATTSSSSSSSSSALASKGGGEGSSAAPPPSPRAYALSPSSQVLLGRGGRPAAADGTGPIPRLQRLGRVADYDLMQVWESNGPAVLRFTSDDVKGDDSDSAAGGLGVLGSVVEDGPLVSALWEDLSSGGDESEGRGAVDFISPARVKSVSLPPSGARGGAVTIGYESSSDDEDESPATETASASLLVAADGANSFVRRSLGMPVFEWGYGRRAVTCTVRLADDGMARGGMRRTAYQRMMPDGPLALLPLWDQGGEKGGSGYASIVWSTTPEHAEKLASLSEDEFVLAVNDVLSSGPELNPPLLPESFTSTLPYPLERIGYGIERLLHGANAGLSMMSMTERKEGYVPPPLVSSVVGRRFAFDLRLLQARSYARMRGGGAVALAGDAAHAVHPMAGQGLNLGLADVDALASLVAEAEGCGMGLSGSSAEGGAGDAFRFFLERYDSERRWGAGIMSGGIHFLHETFRVENGMGVFARSLGMNTVNSLGPVRRRLAEAAVGVVT